MHPSVQANDVEVVIQKVPVKTDTDGNRPRWNNRNVCFVFVLFEPSDTFAYVTDDCVAGLADQVIGVSSLLSKLNLPQT